MLFSICGFRENRQQLSARNAVYHCDFRENWHKISGCNAISIYYFRENRHQSSAYYLAFVVFVKIGIRGLHIML